MTKEFYLIAAVALALAAGSARAACDVGEMCEGDVVSASNLEEALGKTFQGYPVRDMLPERLQWHVREAGLALTLAPTEPYPVDPRYEAATRRYAGEVRFDPATNAVSGWKAGLPFPEIDPANDPHAAAKVIWNLARGRNRGDTLDQPVFAFVLIDGGTGIERVQHWGYRRFGMKGLLRDGVGPVLAGGAIWEKDMLFGVAPQDLKGVGTFTLRYDDGRFNDVWAYVREVRRTRRLTGSTWMDPVSGTDWLNDDLLSFGAYPAWYKEFRYLGSATVLGIAHATLPVWRYGAEDRASEFPQLDVSGAPYWNLRDRWELRKVHVIEAVPPSEHPYSRKVLYIDAETWNSYFNVMYDRAGEHWKSQMVAYAPWPLADAPGRMGNVDVSSTVIDLKRRHATAFVIRSDLVLNAPLREEDISLAALEAMGR